jgi:hypothetical protein
VFRSTAATLAARCRAAPGFALPRVRAMAASSNVETDAFADRTARIAHRKASRWRACVLSSVLASGASCGGMLKGAEESGDAGTNSPHPLSSEGSSEEGLDGSSPLSSEGSSEEGLDGSSPLLNASDASEKPEEAGDGAPDINTGVLCGYHTGPLAPGQDAGGSVMRCDPGWVCLMLNAAWACCTPQGPGSGGGAFCNQFFPG